MKLLGRKRLRTCLSMLLIVTCLLASFSFYNIRTNAKTIQIGTVTASSLHLRAAAGKDNAHVTYLYAGESGTILGQGTAPDGKVWYQMNIKGYTGWASSDYITVSYQDVQEDESFEEYLNRQNFPETYKSQLRILHTQYPNWVFEAQHTNLNWNDVIAAESALGKNLVSNGSPSSWKSTEEGAYDPATGQWKEFDSGGWVAASSEIVQYYMDPRNFLDSTNIFQFIKQEYSPNAISKEQLTKMVSGTYLTGNCDGRSYVDVIMEAATISGVCPFTIASIMIQEQRSDGGGKCISGTVPGYEGYYNYFNIGAYKTSQMSAIQRGLWYASQTGGFDRPWNTRTKSIIGGAKYYAQEYVNAGQNTLYLKKFNVQGEQMYGHQYMTNVGGASSEGKHVSKAYDEEGRKAQLVFRIPIYSNMPENACQKPTDNTPPTSGGGNAPSTVATPSIGSPNYSVQGNKITGISDYANTNVAGLISKLTISNGKVIITSANGVEKAGSAQIGTGDQVRVFDEVGAHRFTYNIIVYGDTNGDGSINALDLLRVQKKILGIGNLSGVYDSAADTNKNGQINGLDLLQVQKHILKIKLIQQ